MNRRFKVIATGRDPRRWISLRAAVAPLILAAGLSWMPAARAETPAPPPAEPPGNTFPLDDQAAKLAREAIEKIMQALQLVIDKIPQYETPEILPNGDIIIRRKHKTPEAPESPAKPAPAKPGEQRT